MPCVSKQPPTPIVRNHLCGVKSYCAFSHVTRNFHLRLKIVQLTWNAWVTGRMLDRGSRVLDLRIAGSDKRTRGAGCHRLAVHAKVLGTIPHVFDRLVMHGHGYSVSENGAGVLGGDLSFKC